MRGSEESESGPLLCGGRARFYRRAEKWGSAWRVDSGSPFFKMREIAVHADGEERLEGEIGYPRGNGKMAGTGSWGR